MESYEASHQGVTSAAIWTGLDAELRLASNGLATATLVVFLLCASRESLAQAGAEAGTSLVSSVSTSGAVAVAIAAEQPIGIAATKVHRLRDFDALLAVRNTPATVTAQETDAAIAAAVSRGTAKELVRPNPFRKKSSDLFRTQRAVQLGNQDLVVRLRLKPKTREVMAVEVRF